MLMHMLIKVKDFHIFIGNTLQRRLQKFNYSIKMYEIAIKINPFGAEAYYNKVERLILIIQEIPLIKLENLKRLKICLILHLKWIP